MPTFVYRERTQASIQHRATRQGGDFQGFVRDDFRMFRPDKGENCVRMLPSTWETADHYGLDVYVHYRIGPENASVLCLRKMLKEPCPICEAIADMDKAGEADAAKEIAPRLAILAWVINRRKQSDGPLLWAIPNSLDREIQKHSQDRRTGEYFVIDHPDHGYDIYFDKTGDGLATRYEGVSMARDPTSVDQQWLQWVADYPVPDTLTWRDYNEIMELFSGGVPRIGAGNGASRRRPPDTAPSQRRTEAPSSPSARRPLSAPAPSRPAASPPSGAPRLAPRPPLRQAAPEAEPEYEEQEQQQPPFDNGQSYDQADYDPAEEPQQATPPVRRPLRTPAAPPQASQPRTPSQADALRAKFAQRGR